MRGLKSETLIILNSAIASHRSRGAWIEMHETSFRGSALSCRIAHAVRGLKSFVEADYIKEYPSHRSRGAWIEIAIKSKKTTGIVSHRSRGAWIEISSFIISK